MFKFIARRVLETIPVLFIIITGSFFLITACPAGRSTASGARRRRSSATSSEYYGLDKPLPVQYVRYLGNSPPRRPGAVVQVRLAHGQRDHRRLAAGVVRAGLLRHGHRDAHRRDGGHHRLAAAELGDRLCADDPGDGRRVPADVRARAAAGAGFAMYKAVASVANRAAGGCWRPWRRWEPDNSRVGGGLGGAVLSRRPWFLLDVGRPCCRR